MAVSHCWRRLEEKGRYYHVSEKNRTPSCPWLCHLLTDIQNSFTLWFSRKRTMKRSLKSPPHLTRVATRTTAWYITSNSSPTLSKICDCFSYDTLPCHVISAILKFSRQRDIGTLLTRFLYSARWESDYTLYVTYAVATLLTVQQLSENQR